MNRIVALPILGLLLVLASAPAKAATAEECGACTELDRITTADPVPPPDLPQPEPEKYDTTIARRGKPIDVPLPGQDITVFHKKGSGFWVSDLAGGDVYVKPAGSKLSVDLKYGF